MENSVKDHVRVLEGLWKEPEKRLQEARADDEAIARELTWLESGGDADEYDPSHADGKMTDDNKSEFSMASMRSDLSFVSGVSSVLSELTGLSSQSTSSRASKAGSATVSVLSELKIDKKGGSSAKGGENSAHSFAIKGIEHSLLSRGTGLHDNSLWQGSMGCREDDLQLSKKQLRRKYRENNKPSSSLFKDTLGLGKEVKACNELWRLAHVSHIAVKCEELCRVLLLLGGTQTTVLAARVQYAMDSYTETLRSHPPIVAPAYPRHWLASKDMSIIRRFQEATVHTDALIGRGTTKKRHNSKENLSFWALAAAGISSWHARHRLAALADSGPGGDDIIAMLAVSASADGDY